jgi:hypothetical protein
MPRSGATAQVYRLRIVSNGRHRAGRHRNVPQHYPAVPSAHLAYLILHRNPHADTGRRADANSYGFRATARDPYTVSRS